MHLSRPQLKVLASTMFHYFRGLDRPPADEIFIPIEAIHKEDQNTYHATVRFIVDYCGRKVHSVRIKFDVDNTGRFLPSTWQYV